MADLVTAIQLLSWSSSPLKPSPTGTLGPEWMILKADVSKAHRRIKVLSKGWKFQVAINKGHYWVNKVGTYGMASAQLYWGRMAALLIRFLYSLFPTVKWPFVFVDDFAWVLKMDKGQRMATSMMANLWAL